MARGFKSGGISVSGGDALPQDILIGKSAYVGGKEIIGIIPNNGSVSGTIDTVSQEIVPDEGYHDGTGTITINATEQGKLIATNIKKNVSILGVEGSLEEGVDTSDATVTAGDILSGKTAYAKGSKITGNIGSQAAKTVTPSTSSQTAVSAGTYCSGAITVGAIPNQTDGGTKYATTSAQTLISAPKYLKTDLKIGALSQSGLSSANIVRGKTITISNGSTNVWSVTGSANGLTYKTGTANCGTSTKSMMYSNDEKVYDVYFASINPGMTPVFCFSYNPSDANCVVMFRTSANNSDWICMPYKQAGYANNMSSDGWRWASNAVDIPVRIGGDASASITYIIWGY